LFFNNTDKLVKWDRPSIINQKQQRRLVHICRAPEAEERRAWTPTSEHPSLLFLLGGKPRAFASKHAIIPSPLLLCSAVCLQTDMAIDAAPTDGSPFSNRLVVGFRSSRRGQAGTAPSQGQRRGGSTRGEDMTTETRKAQANGTKEVTVHT
jgi:hypothetical protein